MELRQLRYFLSVADARSFVSAAGSLYISRQAISKAIAQLEAELGVELFMRDSSGAFLTPAGIMFYDRIRSIVMELDNVQSQMQAYGTRYHQRIRLAVSIGAIPLLEEKLLDYRDNQQNAEILYREQPEQECTRLLMEHQADMAVSTEPLQDPLFTSEELLRSRLGVLMQLKPDLEDVTELTLKELSWLPVAGSSDNQIREFCGKHNIRLQYSGFDYHRLFSLAAAGKCALILPKCLVPRNIPDVTWIPLAPVELWRLYRIYPKSIEKNPLYSAAMEDLYTHVFHHITDL